MQYAGAPYKAAASATTPYKTGVLQHSDTYVWNTADAVGKGATATVYFGRHQVTGDVCAVKVFYERESRHLLSTRRREIETLRTVKHRNLVKLLALEKETISGNEVLVMEYCSGGSLYSMLDLPLYAYGFPEQEFLLVLVHVASGIHYMRSMGFIHRDIKPGNIMRFIGEDGRSVYKITDFGASRTLEDEETFMSIYGTEEYLFPKMYERAVLRQPVSQPFDASVDIWSLGVTLYHVATGQLPFQPHGGRSNTATMHEITSSKPSGVISGVQNVANGPIFWSTTLPKYCQLSESLQRLLIPVLAGLMEVDKAQMWTFERFFQTVNSIDDMIVLHIFYLSTGQDIPVSVNKQDTYSSLQEQLAAITEIPSSAQLILWTDRELSEVVDERAHIQTYPRRILKDQLFLYNRNLMDTPPSLKTDSVPHFPSIDQVTDLDRDHHTGKKANAVANYLCEATGTTIRRQELLVQGESLLRRFIKRIVWQVERFVPEMKQTLHELDRRQRLFLSAYNTVLELFGTLINLVDTGALSFSYERLAKQIRDSLDELARCVKDKSLLHFHTKIETKLQEIEVYVTVLSQKVTEQENDAILACAGCLDEDYCLSKVEGLKQKIGNSATTLSKHKKYRELHEHEDFIHKCEKQKLEENCVELLSIFQEHCSRNLRQSFHATTKHISMLTKHLTRTKKVEQNISSVTECLQQLSRKLGEEEDHCQPIANKMNTLLKDTLTTGVAKPRPLDRPTPTALVSFVNAPIIVTQPPDGAENVNTTVDWMGGVTAPPTVQETRLQGGPMLQPTIAWGARGELISRQAEKITGAGGQSEKDSGNGSAESRTSRAVLLGRLNHELMSLQQESDSLKHLVAENSDIMTRFLNETTNLQIEGSLDSDPIHSAKADPP